MKPLPVILLTLTLPACTIIPYGEEASDAAVQRYRSANADLSDASEAWMCRGMSIREWMLRYGSDPDRALSWRTLCLEQQGVALPVEVEER